MAGVERGTQLCHTVLQAIAVQSGADVAGETAVVAGTDDPAGGAAALADLGPALVAVKLGPEGSLARHAGEEIRRPAFPAEVADAIGAGDCFDAGFLFALWRGSGLGDALAFGNAAAAVYISRREDRFPRRDDVEKVLSARRASARPTESDHPPKVR